MIDDLAREPREYVADGFAADQSSHPPDRSRTDCQGGGSPMGVILNETPAGLSLVRENQEADLLPSLADLELSAISWLSPNRIGLGLLHIIEGETESGVDEVVANLVAAVSTGRALPGGNRGSALTVLIAALGDDFRTHYGPLLAAAGTDLARIRTGLNYTFPRDFERLERHIRDCNVNVVVIPNAFSFLDPALNPSYDHVSWPIIRGFKEIIGRAGTTIFLTRGMGKSTSRQAPALHKGAGSTAWAEAADVVLSVTRESDLVTIETVRLRQGQKPGPLNADITWSAADNAHRLTYRAPAKQNRKVRTS